MFTLLGIACRSCGSVWAGMLPANGETIACPICYNVLDVRKQYEWINLGYEEQKKAWEALNGPAGQSDSRTPGLSGPDH